MKYSSIIIFGFLVYVTEVKAEIVREKSYVKGISNVNLVSVETDTIRKNRIGVNISSYGGAGGDYTYEKIWADAMRSHRYWSKISSSATAADASLDESGWPAEDALCLVYHGLSTGNNYGTYKLIFKCNNPSGISVTSSQASISNKFINGDIVTYDLVISDINNIMLFIAFNNTGGGVKNVKLMRPISPGSSNSYPEETIFTNEIINAVEPFNVLRYMNWMRTTFPGCDSLWEKRTSWVYATQQPKNPYTNNWGGSQPSWETVVLFSNTTMKDAWINIPVRATDDYITNLAILFRDGNLYCDPLKSELKLYLEYANEVWNMGSFGKQAEWIKGQLSKYPELTFDGETDKTTIYHRFVAMRTVQISNIFRQIFGDDQMMTRIRPVLCHQKAYIDVMNRTMTFADRYYNKMDPRSTWPTPHPLNYYLYSFSTGIYWSPVNAPPALTIDNVWDNGEWNPDTYYNSVKIGPIMAKTYGLHFLSYESGPHPKYNGDETILKSAAVDQRMRDKQIKMQRVFNRFDGEVNMLFTLIGSNSPFDILRADVINLNRPRYQSVIDIKEETPADVTLGSLAPFTREGHDYDLEGTWGVPPSAGCYLITARSSNYFTSYCFRVSDSGYYNVQIEYSTIANASLVVDFKGETIANFSLGNTGGTVSKTSKMNIRCESDKLYAIKVSVKEGSATIRSVSVNKGMDTGIENSSDLLSMDNINLFPNPANDIINIEVGNPCGKILYIEIVDLTGEILLKVQRQVCTSNNQVCLPIDFLDEGIYILKVSSGDKTSGRKILIKK